MYLFTFIKAKIIELQRNNMNILTMLTAIIQSVKRLSVLSLFILFYFGIATVNLGALFTQLSNDSSTGIELLDTNWMASAQAVEETVGDNFNSSTVSYSQNSGSQNWNGNWIEVGESDGVSAGIARVRGDLCSRENCLRLGVPSGSPRETYSNKGVYRELDLSGATDVTLSFVYRRAHSRGNQTVVLSVYDGTNWIDLNSYRINTHNTSPISASFDISDYAASNTRIRFLATGNNAIIGMYIDDIEVNYEVTVPTILSVATENVIQQYQVSSYGGSSQDRTGTVEVQDTGLSLSLIGNRWQKIDFPYTVTENTIIEFDFKSDIEGEIQGLGFDTDLSISADRSFKVYGTQNWGISDFDTYSGGVTHFTIPVGEFYTGNFQYLFFINDDDSNPTGESLFSNINVYEKNKLLAEYHFDETSWSGVNEDVLDSSGNDLHGTATNVQPVSGLVCNAADFNRSNRIEVANNTLLEVGGNNADYSVNFWINPRSITSGWSNIIHKGSANLERTFAAWFWPNESRIAQAISTTSNDNEYHSSASISLNSWTMVTFVKQGDKLRTYLNGTLEIESTLTGPSKSNSGPLYIGDDPWYTGIDALMDELTIFGNALLETDIQSIYSYNLAGKSWDGSERDCPVAASLLAEYRFEGDTWNNTPSVIIDSTDNGYHGKILRDSIIVNPAPVTAPAALTGNPGTCGYASQRSGSIQINGLDLPSGEGLDTTTVGAKTTVTFWMYWNGISNVMPIGWYIHDIWMVGGYIGFNTGGGDLYGTSSAGLANGWHHVAVEFTNGSVTNNKIHIDGNLVEDLAHRRPPRLPNDGRAVVDSEMRIGGWSINTGYDFQGFLDEVRVYKGNLTTDQVVTIMNERHDCDTPSIHHYEVVHDGQGLTCEAESYTVKACTDEACSSLSSESVTLNVLADSNIINTPTFVGSTTISFNHTIAETVSLSLTNPSIDASDPPVCTDGSGTSCDITFSEAGFRFISGISNSTTIPNQTSGSIFSETLKVQAVKDVDGVCSALFTDNKNIDLSQENVAPGGIDGLSFTVNGNSIAKQGDVPSTSSTTLNFVTDSIAILPAPIYHDAGQIRLHADYDVGGVKLSGSSNAFWVSPAKLVVSAKSGGVSLNGTTASTDITHAAGDSFDLTVTAYNSLDVITPNYSPEQIQFKLERTGPTTTGQNSDGNFIYAGTSTSSLTSSLSPVFKNVTLTNFSLGISTYNTAKYSEVGLLNLEVQESNYGDAGIVITATPIDIGRFVPHHFELTTGLDGELTSVCDLNTSFPAMTFAYSGQMSRSSTSSISSKGSLQYQFAPELIITAKSSICPSGVCTTTKNYTGNFLKLLPSDVSYITPTTDTEKLDLLGVKVRLTADLNVGAFNNSEGAITYEFSPEDNFVYLREQNTEVAPFPAKIELGIDAISDSDGVAAIDGDGDVDNNRLWVLKPEGTEIRFGRVTLDNSYGPETSPIGQVLSVEYFDGNKFVLADTDTCTQYNSTNVSFGLLNAVSLDSANIPTVSGSFTDIDDFPNGVTRQIVLPAVAAGNQGKVDVIYSIYPWLQYDWDWNGVEVKTFDENPSAIATYGLFRGNDRIIYNREVF
jgi:MSHA biogenesis protein MshQ